jgi:hypothetical protein
MRSATLVPTWGDGSGPGSGGTIQLPDDTPLKMWMGQWDTAVLSFSSNWKELKTLHLTLEQIRRHAPDSVRGTTIFYFTDNSTTYWIMSSGSSPSPGLHDLIEEIRLLELDLECSLQVVHVPGLVMINQGTDGLSRGVWASFLHNLVHQESLARHIFSPLQPDYSLITQLIRVYDLPVQWRYQDWSCPWATETLFDTMSVWFPPPEIARQCITCCLDARAEKPLTTAALFVVPRVLPAFWHGLSRHIIELPTIYPHRTDNAVCMRFPPAIPIPVVILYIPSHTRALRVSPSRLDPTTPPSQIRWHREQAEFVRGLR